MPADQASDSKEWEAQKDVSGRLMDLYAVGTGLALAIGVERMVRFTDESDALIRWESLPLFIALVATLIPFYHGALRHLYKRWIESHDCMTRRSMMVDFVMLFVGVVVMLAMGFVLTQPWTFAVALVALLVLDCLWALTFDYLVDRPVRQRMTDWLSRLLKASLAFARDPLSRSRPGAHPELNWLWLNLGALVVAVPALAVLAWTGSSVDSVGFSLAVMAFALLRTLLDYWVNAGFYFPGVPSERTHQTASHA
jgi:hypothetical protein